jgi:hypothetical protein
MAPRRISESGLDLNCFFQKIQLVKKSRLRFNCWMAVWSKGFVQNSAGSGRRFRSVEGVFVTADNTDR